VNLIQLVGIRDHVKEHKNVGLPH